MTRSYDLRECVRVKNKNINKTDEKDDETNTNTNSDFTLEVVGSESASNPLLTFGYHEADPDLIDQLYSSPKSRPLRGEAASYWDQD
jgi:hypothetical protein